MVYSMSLHDKHDSPQGLLLMRKALKRHYNLQITSDLLFENHNGPAEELKASQRGLPDAHTT